MYRTNSAPFMPLKSTLL